MTAVQVLTRGRQPYECMLSSDVISQVLLMSYYGVRGKQQVLIGCQRHPFSQSVESVVDNFPALS